MGGKSAFTELVIGPHTIQDNNNLRGICTVLGIRGNPEIMRITGLYIGNMQICPHVRKLSALVMDEKDMMTSSKVLTMP